MRILLTLACVLLISACQGTAFEKAPVAETGCDTALVGTWDSVEDDGKVDGEVRAQIGGDCKLEVFERKDNVMRAGDATTLHVGKGGTHGYVWVDSAWSLKRFSGGFEGKPAGFYLMRYRVDGELLILHGPDDRWVAHRIIDEDIEGETQKNGEGLNNRITGGPHPKVLDMPGFFGTEDVRFRRVHD